MKRVSFNKGWEYKQSGSWWSPQERISVDLPHDYSMDIKRSADALGENSTGYANGGIISYFKSLMIPKEWAEKLIMLEFEGAYMNAQVKLNGNIIKKQPYGYTTFHVTLDKFVRYGEENVIEVKVTNNSKNSRWYSGTGLYRPVWLMVSDKQHIEPWGTHILTSNITAEAAEIYIETKAVKDSDTDIKYTIFAPNGDVISEWKNKSEWQINNPEIWDIDTPKLYTLKTELVDKNCNLLDEAVENFGIREISLSAKEGFKLNGKMIKLKGGCVHHDNGILGASSYEAAETRKVRLLKEAGFNAVRCSHNPPSVTFLNACDRMGLLVIDEIFDGWVDCKTPYDYGMYFEEFWERDFEAMLLRDRNHPSVIIWSTGNEVAERGGKSDGYAWSKRLAEFAKKYDTTRFTTNAVNDIKGDLEGLAANIENMTAKGEFAALTEHFFKPLDIAGYNYLNFRYKTDSELYPERVICGLESFPMMAYENWEDVNSLPNVIGDFVWTAIDYLGEAGLGHIWYNGETDFLGSYPWFAAYCGDYDICGFKRPQSYYRDCVWGIDTKPYIAVYRPEFDRSKANISRWGWQDVISSWDFNENTNIDIEVYSSDSEVELILNGRSLGIKPTEKHKACYSVPYERGGLVARAVNRKTEYIIRTPDKAATLKLTPDNKLGMGEFDICYISIELADENGIPILKGELEINVEVKGSAKLIALGNGNPKGEEMYNNKHIHLFEGRALAIIKYTEGMDKVVFTAEADGIKNEIIIDLEG